MRRTLVPVGLAVGLLLAGGCGGETSVSGLPSCDDQAEKGIVSPRCADSVDDIRAGGDESTTTATTEEPVLDGDYNLRCDYLLGDFSEGTERGVRFVGGGTVHNTGTIGLKLDVKFEWDLLGEEPVTKVIPLKLEEGQRKEVNVTVPATHDQIDAHQAADSKCRATTKITGPA